MQPTPVRDIMPPVILTRFLLHLGVPLALLGLWLSPVPVEGRSVPASAARSEVDHTVRAVISPAATTGTQAPLPRITDGPVPVAAEAGFAWRLAPPQTHFEALRPAEPTRARSAGPIYHVLRSGQAHRSAP